jgi:hypothetical protein
LYAEFDCEKMPLKWWKILIVKNCSFGRTAECSSESLSSKLVCII